MPITTSTTVLEGLPFGDAVSATVVPTTRGAPTELLPIGELVIVEFIPDPRRMVVADAVTVSPAVAPAEWRGRGDAATVADLVGRTLSSYRPVADPLAIQDHVSYFMASPNWVNPAVPVPTPPGSPGTPGNPLDPGNPRVAGTLKLTYLGVDLHLRKPDFGDSDSCDTFRVSRTSRGGDLQIFQDPMWPRTEVLSFKFSGLDPDVADALLDLLESSVGAQVTLVDHFGRTWQGFIITPAGEVVQDKRATLTAAFKFQPISGPT